MSARVIDMDENKRQTRVLLTQILTWALCTAGLLVLIVCVAGQARW